MNYMHRFTRRGVELHFHGPDTGAPAGGGGAAPAIRGVTVKERASRSAQERELSPDNEAIVPELGDITSHLDTHGFKFGKKTTEPPEQEESEQPAEEEQAEEASAETEGIETEEAAAETETEQSGEEQATGEEEAAGAEAGATEGDEEVTDKSGKKIELAPDVQASINARIGELVKEKHTLKGELETIRAERDTLQQQLAAQPVKVTPTPAMPLADVATVADLNARAQQANEVKLWCIENPEGAEVVLKDGEKKFYSPEEIRAIHANAERELSAVPQRQQFLAGKSQADEISRKAYPAAYQSGSPDAQKLQTVKRALPWLAVLPDADLIILDAIAGKAVREKKPAPIVKTPPAKVPMAHSPKPAPRLPATALKGRDAQSNVVKNLGSPKSVQQFAETLVA